MSRVARTAGLLLIALTWAALLSVIGSPEVLLFTIPVFMVAAPLALGRYVGEDLLVRLGRGPRSGRARTRPTRDRLPEGHTTRAGLVWVKRFSGRAPPLPA